MQGLRDRHRARLFNLSGLFGLDLCAIAKGDVHLLEINARATPSAHLVLKQDLPAALLKRRRPALTPARAHDRQERDRDFPREWLRDPASPWLKNAYHDVPWDDSEVVRACVRTAPAANRAAARALLEAANRPRFTQERPCFRGLTGCSHRRLLTNRQATRAVLVKALEGLRFGAFAEGCARLCLHTGPLEVSPASFAPSLPGYGPAYATAAHLSSRRPDPPDRCAPRFDPARRTRHGICLRLWSRCSSPPSIPARRW